MKKRPYITVIGGLLVDIKTWPEALLIPKDSNPGKIEVYPGGVARNIAENLARLEVPCYLLGTVGEDGFGKTLLEATGETGVQVQYIEAVPNRTTGLCVSVFDEQGELAIGMADLSTTAETSVDYLKQTQNVWLGSRLIVIDTNLPIDTLQYLISQANQADIPLLLDPVSIQLAHKITQLTGVIDYMTPNLEEHEMLHQLSLKLKVKEWLISQGEKGLFHLREPSESSQQYAAYPTTVVDVNGAGDAFISGFVYGCYHQQDTKTAIHNGLATAAICLQSPHSVAHSLSPHMLDQMLSNFPL